jgi:hypothetical protein
MRKVGNEELREVLREKHSTGVDQAFFDHYENLIEHDQA